MFTIKANGLVVAMNILPRMTFWPAVSAQNDILAGRVCRSCIEDTSDESDILMLSDSNKETAKECETNYLLHQSDKNSCYALFKRCKELLGCLLLVSIIFNTDILPTHMK